MQIIIPQGFDINNLKPISDDVLNELVKLAFTIKSDTENDAIRDILYKSKYNPSGFKSREVEIENLLNQKNIKHKKQNNEYNHVFINSDDFGQLSYRFYLSPKPSNMHNLVEKIIKKFDSKNEKIYFKYQLDTNMENCDRIIIYSDDAHKDSILKILKEIHDEDETLFEGSERSAGWIYDTDVPDVYMAPEVSPNHAFSKLLCEVLYNAKQAFWYMTNMKKNSSITLDGEDAKTAVTWMKTFITSMMLRNGLLLSKDDTQNRLQEVIRSNYDFDTGVFSNFSNDSDYHYVARYEQTEKGKEAFINNFYDVKEVRPQEGVTIEKQTIEEWQNSLYRHKHHS